MLHGENPNASNPFHVVKDNNLYNMICREYWIQNADAKASAKIYSVSDAVVHQIDSPLHGHLWGRKLNEPLEQNNLGKK